MGKDLELKIDANKNIYNFNGPIEWEKQGLIFEDLDEDGTLDVLRQGYQTFDPQSLASTVNFSDFINGRRQNNRTIKFSLEQPTGAIGNILLGGESIAMRINNQLFKDMDDFTSQSANFSDRAVRVRCYPGSATGLRKIYFENGNGNGGAVYGGILGVGKSEKTELKDLVDVADATELTNRIQTLYNNAVDRNKNVERIWGTAFAAFKDFVKMQPEPKNKFKISYEQTKHGLFLVRINDIAMDEYDLTASKFPSVNDIPSSFDLLSNMQDTFVDLTNMFDFRTRELDIETIHELEG